MDSNPLKPDGLKPGDGMGDFMRFTTDGRFSPRDADPTTHGFTQWPANESATRRLSRIGMFQRTAGRGLRRLV